MHVNNSSDKHGCCLAFYRNLPLYNLKCICPTFSKGLPPLHFLKLREKVVIRRSIRFPKVVYLGLSHYLFEIIVFIGVSFISQTTYALCFTIATIFYLMGMSYATRRWYTSKSEDFPKHVKALIPFVF